MNAKPADSSAMGMHEDAFRSLFNAVRGGLLLIDSKTRKIAAANPAAAMILGADASDIVGRHCADFVANKDRRQFSAVLRGKVTDDADSVVTASTGGTRYISRNVAALVLDGKSYLIFSFIDITRRHELHNRLRMRSTYDPLTRLLSRRAALERLTQDFRQARRYKEPFSVCMCDVDKFKPINDAFGHRAGDQVLRRFGAIVRQALRRIDFAGRYGGDEFLIVFPQTSAKDARECTERIRETVATTRFVTDADAEFSVTSTFGIADLAPEQTRPRDLIIAADHALYRAKMAGRNCSVVS